MTIPTAKYASDAFTEGGFYNAKGMGTKDYSDLIKEACEKKNIPVIDISELWGKNDIANYMKPSSISSLYPNEEGGKLIADTIVARLIEVAEN
jgi:hypothetical protein